MPKKLPAVALVLITLCLSVGCDQSTKIVARNALPNTGVHHVWGEWVILVYAENTGAFLSLGAVWPRPVRQAIFTFLCIAILAALLAYVLRSPRLGVTASMGLSLLAGGGISNLIDRLFRDGRVTDFMNLGIGGLRTGIFNFADLCIMAGALLLLFSQLTPRKAEPRT